MTKILDLEQAYTQQLVSKYLQTKGQSGRVRKKAGHRLANRILPRGSVYMRLIKLENRKYNV